MSRMKWKNTHTHSNSAIDLYAIKAYSLELKQCYNIFIGKEKYYVYLHFKTSPQGHSTTCIKLSFHTLKIQPIPGVVGLLGLTEEPVRHSFFASRSS